MLAEARRRLPGGEFVQGDALALPFPDGTFERIFTSYFYCHLVEEERVQLPRRGTACRIRARRAG